MIPKTIHYVWLGGAPLPDLAQRCVASWKKYCPDYEIIRWDETNFDGNNSRYYQEALAAKKWAFASDYVRLSVLAQHGGIYMDTDVELLKPLDQFLENEAFSGFEAPDRIPTGIMACRPGFPLFQQLLDDYEDRTFLKPDGSCDLTTNVTYITDACLDRGLVLDGQKQTIDGFTLYPTDWFCPKDWLTKQVNLTENSAAIHHFDGSWAGPSTRLKHSVMRALGPKGVATVKRLVGRSK